jgi:isopenicillin N synthase-like dioxygenase
MHLLSYIKNAVLGIIPRARRRAKEQDNVSNVIGSEAGILDIILPLKPVEFPRILPEHRFALADQGWTKVTFHEPVDGLQSASKALFRASKAFFDLPASRKENFRTRAGTEEGWNHVPGEKEFITLRSLETTPPDLRDAAEAYWKAAGNFLDELLERISESLGLPAASLAVYSKPCASMKLHKTATMLRLFRYESTAADETSIVAEGMHI